MKLAILVIGDEILLGQVTDTNSGDISRILGQSGWDTVETRIVGDDPSAITTGIDELLSKSDLVITTGGLGPTKDDITKRVLTEYFGGILQIDPSVTANIEEVFAKRGLKLNDLTRAQALVPSTCRVIQNRLGTAPIMWFEREGKVLISMPGVPFETVGMMRQSVATEINKYFMPDCLILHHTVIVNGITESDLAEHLSDFEEELPTGMHLAYLPVPGYIRLRLDSTGVSHDIYEQVLAKLKRVIKDYLLYDGDASPAEILLERLRTHGYTVSSAESCTGGNIAHSITEIAGCSDCFMGGVVSYSNKVKTNVLGVSTEDLVNYGAVSEPVVRQMAEGVARITNTDCSMATSGVAGPGGGTPDKPVGTVWIAVHAYGRTTAKCFKFPGNRNRVIDRATTEAILMLIKLISKSPSHKKC